MPLQIICLEEHIMDADLSKAAGPALLQQAPYMTDVANTYHDNPADQPKDRPVLMDNKRGAQLARQPVEDRLPQMDTDGIDMQVLSYSDFLQYAPKDKVAELARAANDRLAEIIQKHPTRFSGFATLPWQNVDAAVSELKRCVQELGLRAVLLPGRPGPDSLIDDAQFAPILEMLAALNAPLYIHPGPPLPVVQKPYYGGFNKEVSSRFSLFGWGWHHEAGIQVLRLILSGIMDRLPDLKIISGHWGEMVPFYLQRLDDTIPQQASGLTRTISQTYRDQVWVTPSGMLYTPHFQFIRETLGHERILFSVDYPYVTMTGARSWLEKLEIPENERVAIANGNAKKLLGIHGVVS